jgi:uncharacterized protein YbcI
MQPGDFKQELMKINNAVNQELFGVGLRWQKVEILDDKVLVFAKNQRVRALCVLDGKEGLASRLIDIALLEEYKKRFRQQVEEKLGVRVRSLMKDYDPVEELAFSLVILEGSLDEAIRGIENNRSAG